MQHRRGMRHQPQEKWVEEPLKPTDSSIPPDMEQDPEEGEDHEPPSKPSIVMSSIHDCFGTFLNGTSIRGIKQCLNSPHIALQIFWFLFIVLSFVLVVTVSSFCIISYCNYQTVVRQTKRPVTAQDFPVITLCSDGFFADTPNIRKIATHPLAFDKVLSEKLDFMIRNGKFGLLKQIARLRSMVMYNANNVKTLVNLMKEELSFRSYKEIGILPRISKDTKCNIIPDLQLCNITAFYNFKYRNCLSIRIPQRSRDAKVDRLVINGLLLSSKTPAILPEPSAIGDITMSGRHIHVFLHDEGTLPPDIPDYIVSMTTNRWILIDFDVTDLQRIVTPRQKCAKSPVTNTTHTGNPIRYTPDVCRALKLRQLIRKKCKCESINPPYDVWPVKGHFCGYIQRNKVNFSMAMKEKACELQYEFSASQDISTNCEIPCSEKIYRSRISINDLESNSYNKIVRENEMGQMIPALGRICKSKRRVNKEKCKAMRAVLSVLINNVTISMDEKRVVQPTAKKTLLEEAFPTAVDDEFPNELEKTSFSMTIRCPRMQVDNEVESLVRTIWTTLAQVGGASSFLAGFTFGVIAEVVDTIYKVYISKSKT